jgi:hypothetical protein
VSESSLEARWFTIVFVVVGAFVVGAFVVVVVVVVDVA